MVNFMLLYFVALGENGVKLLVELLSIGQWGRAKFTSYLRETIETGGGGRFGGQILNRVHNFKYIGPIVQENMEE